MYVNSIEVMKRKNLGNYEHFEVKLGASLAENDNFQDSYDKLMADLKYTFGVKPDAKKEEPVAETKTVEAEPAKKPAKKRATKKKTTKKEEVAPVSMDEILGLCRSTANRLGDAGKIKVLIETACGVSSLADADPATFNKLKDLLNDAQ